MQTYSFMHTYYVFINITTAVHLKNIYNAIDVFLLQN